MLALLCASIPMSIILTAALVVVQPDGALVFDPSSNHLKSAASIHVLAFSSHSDTLIVESEGDFSIETWEQVHEKAGQLCHGQENEDSDDEDMSMDSYEKIKLENIMRDAVQEKVTKERKWKEELG